MAGVNDPVFRRICKRFGADLTYSEMVSAVGLSYQSTRSNDLLYADTSEKPFAIQIFGKDADVLARQAALIEQRCSGDLALIDINMGCPTRKIAGKGEGAALMRNLALAESIIRSVVAAVDLPVTVKFRRGFEHDNEIALEFARMAESAGVAAVAVHGRYAEQQYGGIADKTLIGRVKRVVDIPVIASGDVFSVDDVLNYLNRQNADAVMVARGAQGNPWIFAQAKAAVAKNHQEQQSEVTLQDRVDVAREHLIGLNQLFPQRLPSMRKHFAWYFKGIENATEIRRQVNKCIQLDDYLLLLDRVETGMI